MQEIRTVAGGGRRVGRRRTLCRVAAVAAAAVAVSVGAPAPAGAGAATGDDEFKCTGGEQTWTVPPEVLKVYVTVDGAPGGASEFSSSGPGGRAMGTMIVAPGDRFTVIVGCAGSSTDGRGGFGFGNGGDGAFPPGGNPGSGGGGGSALLFEGQPLAVGGGGGGAAVGQDQIDVAGGVGGGLTGDAGNPGACLVRPIPPDCVGSPGGGGTQTGPGAGGVSPPPGPDSDGLDGEGHDGGAGGLLDGPGGVGGGGGGGGGWFGGGGGGGGDDQALANGGGGGSGFADPNFLDNIRLIPGIQDVNGTVTFIYDTSLASTGSTGTANTIAIASLAVLGGALALRIARRQAD